MKKKALISLTISRHVELDVPEKYTDVDLRIAAIRQVELPSIGWDRDELEVIEE